MRRVPIGSPRLAGWLLVALAACGSREDLTKRLDTVASWTATMQLTRAEHRSGALTTAYVTQLGDEAKQALTNARHSLPKLEHDSSDERRAAVALDSLDRVIHALEAEVGR
jgi:hypothetical protein